MRVMNEKNKEQKSMECGIIVEEDKKGRQMKEGTKKHNEKNVDISSLCVNMI